METNELNEKIRLNRERSNANLIPAKKGEVRNPNGRPKQEDTLLSCIKDELDKVTPNGIQTNKQLIGSVLVDMATKGNIKAVELMMSYIHAKPAQGIDLNKDSGLVIRVIRDSSGTGNISQNT